MVIGCVFIVLHILIFMPLLVPIGGFYGSPVNFPFFPPYVSIFSAQLKVQSLAVCLYSLTVILKLNNVYSEDVVFRRFVMCDRSVSVLPLFTLLKLGTECMALPNSCFQSSLFSLYDQSGMAARLVRDGCTQLPIGKPH